MTAAIGALLLAMASMPAQSRPLAIVNGHVIDMVTAESRRASVVVQHGRIQSIVDAGRPLPPGTDSLDALGGWIMPGLWDMHAHIWDRALLFPMYLAYGITGVRDMGTTLGPWLAWRDSVSRGQMDGLHGVVAGTIVDGLYPFAPSFVRAGDSAEAAAAVLLLSRRGADFIKVYDRLTREAYDGIAVAARRAGVPIAGHLPPSVTLAHAVAAGQRSIEHLTSLAIACAPNGHELAGEATRLLDPLRGMDITRDTSLRRTVGAALGPYYEASRDRALDACDPAGMAPVARVLREGGTWVAPTLVLSANVLLADTAAEDSVRARLPSWAAAMTRERPNAITPALKRQRAQKLLAMTRELKRGGVRLLVGSDAPNPGSLPGIGLHREMEFLVRAGFTPYEVLRMATRDAAEFLSMQDSIGTIAPGRLADLILLDGNPLQDIAHARSVRAVVLQGRVIPMTSLAPERRAR